MGLRVLFIDNLDSFTFNLVHYLRVGGAEVEVLRNEGEDWPQLAEKMADCDAWAVGPGRGRPQDYPHLLNALAQFMGKKPLLGICLGQQAIGQVCGWPIVHACTPMHGKPSMIQHNKRGLFEGLSEPIQVGRYHSLILKSDSNENHTAENHFIKNHPAENHSAENREIIKTISADVYQNTRTDLSLQVDAHCEGEIMAVSNPEKGIWAVQFHPESVLTPEGQAMINRWLQLAQDFIRCAEV